MNFKKILKETLTIKFDKAFGLDISDKSIEIIELDKFFKFSVVTYGRTELPDGIIDNGKILNQNILAEKLKKLLKEVKPQKISTNKVVISLPESQVYIQYFIIDTITKPADIPRIVLEKASLVIPLDLDKAYWDYIERPLPDKTKRMIIFISVPKDIANSYVKFCNSIGLEVVSLSTESISLARALLTDTTNHSLIIDLGARATNLSFFDKNDDLNMSVNIPIAGDHMTEEIKNKLKIEKIEAENLKIKLGFKENNDNKVRPVILPIMEQILNEAKLAISYYESNFKQKLENIYIVGGSALLPAVTEVIKNSLKRGVNVGIHSSNLNLKSLTDSNFPVFANVIGLGMLGASVEFRDINFIKKMPPAEVNLVNIFNLFNMGYLSKVNTVRTIINNKYVLAIMIVVIGVIFAVLLQQTKTFENNIPVVTVTSVVKKQVPPRFVGLATSTITTSTSSKTNLINTPISMPVPVPTPKPAVSTTTNKYIFTTEISLNSYGDAVTNLQDRLSKEGYYNGLVGGFFGPATETGVKNYQKANGLIETGKLDLETRNKLNGK